MNIRNKLVGLKSIWQFDNRWQLLVSRVFFRKNGLNIYRMKGMDILVDHAAGDQCGTRHVLVSQMYKRFLPYMKLSASTNVLDLGANGGGFPLMLNMSGIRLKKVVCVEFHPDTFLRMRFNIERNLDCEFIGYNVAICGEPRVVEVYLGVGSTSSNIYQTEDNAGKKLYHIKGMTFDEIYRNSFADGVIDICKMDVEGAEYDVFSTPYHKFLVRCRQVIIEIHKRCGRQKSEVIDRIEQLGFRKLPRGTVGVEQDVYFFENLSLNN